MSPPSIKSLFQDSKTIWLAPNEMSLAQIRRALFKDELDSGGDVRLESFNSLERSLAAELRPPEADELGRLFILNDLARPLAETLSQSLGLKLGDISPAELKKLAEDLGDAFDRLKLAGLGWDKVAELPPRKLGTALAELGRRHDRLLAEMGRLDRFARRRQVLEELAAGRPFRGLKGVEEIVGRWSQRLSPFEVDFIIALARRRRVKLTLRIPAWVRDENIDHGSGFDLLRSIIRLEKSGLDNLDLEFEELAEGPAPAPLAYAAEKLLAPPAYREERPPQLEGRLRLLAAPTRYQEVEEAARRLKELLAEGLPPDDLALVVPDVDQYSALIDDLARRFGLAFHLRRGRPLSEYGPVRAALEILDLWGSNWERSRLAEFLRSPYFIFSGPSDKNGRLDPALVSRLTLKSGMSDRRAGGGFELLGKIRGREAEKLLTIFTKLKEAGDRAAEASSWPELINIFTEVLNRLLWPGRLEEAPQAPLNIQAGDFSAAFAFKKQLEILSQSLAESPCPPEVSLDNFRLWLENLVGQKHLSWDADPEGRIRVMNYYDLHGGVFEEIFFLGLNERVFPRTGSEGRWWPEDFVRAAGRLLGRPLWSDESDNYRQEELLLACGLAQAKRRVWLFHHLNDEAGRELLPSPLLAALRELWTDEKGLSLLVVEETGEQGAALEQAAGPDELLPALMRLAREDWPEALAADPALSRAAEEIKSRWQRWQALKKAAAPGARAMAEWLAKLPAEEGRPLVTASLPAAFAACPLAFWGEKVLGLAGDGQEIGEWPRSGEGNLLHAVLESFFRPRLGSLWPGEAKYEDCLAELMEILEVESARHALENPLGRLPLWELRQGELKNFLKAWLRREMDQENVRPQAVEWSFGTGEEGAARPLDFPFPGGGAGLYFKGRVDRIDLGPQGLLVRDYKLSERGLQIGKNREISPGVWPIAVYALAAARDFGGRAEGLFEILSPSARKSRLAALATDQAELSWPDSTEGLENQEEEPEAKFNFHREVAKTWAGLSQGLFIPQGEDSGQCAWCPLALFCPKGRDSDENGEEE